jgi:hypothetical protein
MLFPDYPHTAVSYLRVPRLEGSGTVLSIELIGPNDHLVAIAKVNNGSFGYFVPRCSFRFRFLWSAILESFSIGSLREPRGPRGKTLVYRSFHIESRFRMSLSQVASANRNWSPKTTTDDGTTLDFNRRPKHHPSRKRQPIPISRLESLC